jgi:hypothetical protein
MILTSTHPMDETNYADDPDDDVDRLIARGLRAT